MTTTSCIRLMVTAALLVSPIAASAQNSSIKTAQLAENSVAEATTGSSAQQKAAPAATAEKKVCKQLPSSYSRMTKRTCLTEQQWKQVEADAQGN
jgi:hypothetical protein